MTTVTKNILIAERDPVIYNSLYEIIRKYGRNICVFRTGQVTEAERIINENKIELMIVDACLSKNQHDRKGMEFISRVREQEQYVFVPVILLSCDRKDQYPAFHKLHCYDVLEKPLVLQDAEGLIRQAMCYRMPETEKQHIHFRNGCVVYRVRISEIVFIEHKRRNMYVHTRSEVMQIPYQTCKETIERLKDSHFEICARGKIVNMGFVQEIDICRRQIILKDNQGRLDVGRNYMRTMKDTLRNG